MLEDQKTESKAKSIAMEKWRCHVCTFLNDMTVEACTRCREPVNDEMKAQSKVPFVKVLPGSSPEKKVSAWPRKTEGKSTSSPPKKQPSAKTSFGQKKSGATINDNKLNKKHQGDLGYVSKKGNIHTLTKSKLNHDTASYRAKFEKEDKDPKAKKSNIVTLSNLVKNGFVTSTGPAKVNKHDETPAPKPAKYQFGGNKPKDGKSSVISMLQAACSPNAVPSLKDRQVQVSSGPAQKALGDGQYTKLAL